MAEAPKVTKPRVAAKYFDHDNLRISPGQSVNLTKEDEERLADFLEPVGYDPATGKPGSVPAPGPAPETRPINATSTGPVAAQETPAPGGTRKGRQ